MKVTMNSASHHNVVAVAAHSPKESGHFDKRAHGPYREQLQ